MKKKYLKWLGLGFGSICFIIINYIYPYNSNYNIYSDQLEEESTLFSFFSDKNSVHLNPVFNYDAQKSSGYSSGTSSNAGAGSGGYAFSGFQTSTVHKNTYDNENTVSYHEITAMNGGSNDGGVGGGAIAFGFSISGINKETKNKRNTNNGTFAGRTFGTGFNQQGNSDQIAEGPPTVPQEIPLDNGIIFIIVGCIVICFYRLYYKPNQTVKTSE